ncbi:hypothetical protein SEA_LIMPID_140 [Streptomyces phage Limpid]|uniref:Uncharacterized protein n=1 Tax=Streptomyces phage Limpid TaxID=2653770 RepID=A0A5Q2WP91_9CAUD|nr:hypothetical protein SEA_LIMPID_140 [Streptomyces phage Limpid]
MDWQTKAFLICIAVSIVCKIGTLLLRSMEAEEPEIVPMNRAQRRHPKGRVAAQKFGRQNQAIKMKPGKGGSHRKFVR